MGKVTDVTPRDVKIYFLPVETRIPVKFGPETLIHVTCARVMMRVEDRLGRSAEGWGETPLSVQWVWPSSLPYGPRHLALRDFTVKLGKAWKEFNEPGHPLDVGHAFQETVLPGLWGEFNSNLKKSERLPWLAALVCCSAFDIALHDGYGILHKRPVYETYNAQYMNHDLSHFLVPVRGKPEAFSGTYPEDFFVRPAEQQLVAWHLVGGKDLLLPSELTGTEPYDVWELSALLDHAGFRPARRNGGRRVAYHDSCHMLRELRITDPPRRLLEASGAELVPLARPDLCCGFGGTFSVRQPEVSVAMADDKLGDSAATGVLVTADPGCLMHLRGRAERTVAPVRVVHLATALAEGIGD